MSPEAKKMFEAQRQYQIALEYARFWYDEVSPAEELERAEHALHQANWDLVVSGICL